MPYLKQLLLKNLKSKKVKLSKGHGQKTHNNGGNFNQPQPKPQENQIIYVVNQAQTILQLLPPRKRNNQPRNQYQ